MQSGIHRFAFAVWLAASIAFAVDMTPLDAAQLAATPEIARWGVVPGDVAMRNDAVQVVVQATPVKGQGARVGRCLLFAPQGGEPFGVEFGPASEWSRGEGGRGSNVAVVKFVRSSADWNAELVFQLTDGSPWLDVSTTIRNTSKTTIEIPIVDAVHAPAGAKSLKEDSHNATVLGTADGPTFASLVLKSRANLGGGRKGEWFIAHVSGDPTPGLLPRMGKRLIRFGRSDVSNPVAADSDWDATAKDHRNWFRIPAGSERTLSRRLMISAAGSEMKPLIELASQKTAPMVQIVSSGSKAVPSKPVPSVARRSSASSSKSVASTPKNSAPPVANVVRQTGPTISEPKAPDFPTMNVAAKESLPAPPAPPKPTAPPAAAKPTVAKPPAANSGDGLIVVPADETPKVVDEVLKGLKDLPPPIK